MTNSLKSLQIFRRGSKLSILAVTSSILSAALMVLSIGSVSAVEENFNYIGPSITFTGGTTLYGVTSKFRVVENVSVRPFIQFTNSSNGSATVYGGTVTYDFSIPQSGLVPYLGGGLLEVNTTGTAIGRGGGYFEAGVDYNASDNISINANYRTGQDGLFNVGAGYRF
jgi:opacity protein-like surface antigen